MTKNRCGLMMLKGMFKCFFCGAGGDSIAFVKGFKKISKEEAQLEVQAFEQKFKS
jgi:DNA primase